MPSILTVPILERLVEIVNKPEDIDTVVARFDPSSKDTVLFFQALGEAGKQPILDEYEASFVEEEE
jgi:hypothetical protein